MDLNKARTFVEVVKSGSMTRAAAQLHRTQQAISLQLKGLEEEIKLVLFDRNGPQLVLTQDGRRLFEQVRRSFDEVDRELYAIRSDKSSATGTIRLGVWMEQGIPWLPDLVAGFLLNYPRVSFEVTIGDDRDLELALVENKLDISFQLYVQEIKLLEKRSVLRRELILVASNEYLLGRKVRTAEDTLRLSLIDYGGGYASYVAWIRKNHPANLAQARKKVPVVAVKNDLVMKELVLRNMGMALLPREIIVQELATSRLLPIPSKRAKPIFADIELVTKRRESRGFVQDAFIKHVLTG